MAEPDFRPGLAALLDQAMIRPATPEEGLPLRLVAAERALEAMAAERDHYKAALQRAVKTLDDIAHPGAGEDHYGAMSEASSLSDRLEAALKGGPNA